MDATPQDFLIQLLPLILLQGITAIITFVLATRMRANRWLWTLLTIVPFLGLFVWAVFQIRALFVLFDRIEQLENKQN